MSNCGHFWGQLKLVNNSVVQGIFSALGGTAPMGRMQNFAQQRLDARKKGDDGADREDMLAHFVRMKSLDGTGPAEDGEILVEAMNIM